MVKRNRQFTKLTPHYLFPELKRRQRAFEEENPKAKVLSLSIGDTSEPIPESIVETMREAASKLGTSRGYTGYGPEEGNHALRHALASEFYGHRVSADEVFISDGAKCDIGRLQLLFGHEASIAVQDPSYPVYAESGLLIGQNTIHTLPCLPENAFFPNSIPQVDLIYICSPNNPTGAVATHGQLAQLVSLAKAQGSIIIFDSAYAGFIRDPSLPRSIYEIAGAEEVAIEVSSFSKLIGFTGVRLGWTVVPKALRYENGEPVREDWHRLISTLFNGASNVAQAGGLAALSPEGKKEIERLVTFYLENAALLRTALRERGVYGGVNAPYLWVECGETKSWAFFEELLKTYHLLATPGAGFGSHGEGFIRLSAFGSRAHILEAANRLSHG